MNISEDAFTKSVSHFVSEARVWSKRGSTEQVKYAWRSLHGIAMVAAFGGVSAQLEETIQKAIGEVIQLLADTSNAEITRIAGGAAS